MTFLHASKSGIRRLYSSHCAALRGWPTQHASRGQQRCRSSVGALMDRAEPHLPRILQRSMWDNIIPPTLRSKTRELFTDRHKKPTNPATYFIWIYILIGSQAIRIIQTKNDFHTFSRKADLQIEKLREVVRRLQAGEEVDVEKALGTGVPEEEEAWEEAMREIEREERLWTENKQKKKEAQEQQLREAQEEEKQRQDASPVSHLADPAGTPESASSSSSSAPPFKAPGFY